MSEVQHALAARITASPIHKDQRVVLELDGELPGFLPATFQIIPRALRIRCPR
jgi:diacylglycerol kinase family enzyme